MTHKDQIGRDAGDGRLMGVLPWVLLFIAVAIAYRAWRGERNAPPRPEQPVFANAQLNNGAPPGAAPREVAPRQELDDDEQATIELFKKCSASVAFIKTSVVGRSRLSANMLEIPRGTGSGFVWDSDGHIVTNYHVVENSTTMRVVLADHSVWPADKVGEEKRKDLAVLKIKAPPDRLFPLPVGTSRDLLVGQSVYAIGNPFGLDQTLTTGVISGLEREIPSRTKILIEGVIQTDAAINPGNSGGPLLDSSGRLIGVNTAIFSPSGAYAGVGFAIPVDTVNRVVPQLIKYGETVDRPWLGVLLNPPNHQLSLVLRRMGIGGVLVREVVPGSTAEEAGIQPTTIDGDNWSLGDLIVAIDDRRVNNTDDLLDALTERKVGDTVSISVIRGLDTDKPKQIKLDGRLKMRVYEDD